MSRRRAKAAEAAEVKWEEFVAKQYVGGGEEYHLSHESLAYEAGLDYLEYVTTYGDGSEEVDADRLVRDAQVAQSVEEHGPDLRVPLGFMEIRCNKCGHRIDVLSLVRPDPTAEAVLRSRYQSGFRMQIGEAPKWPQGPKYGCRRCGRLGLLLSMRRVENFFGAIHAASVAGTIPEVVERQVVRV